MAGEAKIVSNKGLAGSPTSTVVTQSQIEDKPEQLNEIDKLRAELAGMKQLLSETVALISQQQPTQPLAPSTISSTDILAQEHNAIKKRKTQRDKFNDWASRSTQSRSQEEADRRYPDGARRFKVHVRGKPDSKADEFGRTEGSNTKYLDTGLPGLEINANDRTHAQARYIELCGIRWLQGPTFQIEDIGSGQKFLFGPPANDLSPPEPILAAAS